MTHILAEKSNRPSSDTERRGVGASAGVFAAEGVVGVLGGVVQVGERFLGVITVSFERGNEAGLPQKGGYPK